MKTPLHDIATLAGSLETELKTVELHKSNDFYGFASVLKQYAGVPDSYQIKAAIEHGPLMGDCIWEQDVQAPLPAIFPMSRCRRVFLDRKTDKPVIPIGPVITYAEGYLAAEELRAEKQKRGRTLLAFPAHSTHWIDVEYDINAYCSFLEDLGKSFDTITICLYWKDVLRNIAEYYRKRGFHCVTAGHMFDPLFMPRLRSIIELADLTTSNEISSVLGYCVLLGRPHYYHEVHTTWKAPSPDILTRDTCGGKGARPFFRWIFDLFREPKDDITNRQQEVVSYYWGLYDSKTPKEMAVLFQIADEMYRRRLSRRRDFIALSLQKTGEDMSACSKVSPQKPGQRGLEEKTNSLRASDVLIASYPRSGNTWMRLLLADVILQYHGFQTDTRMPIHEDNVIPELPTADKVDLRIHLPFRLIKSHGTYDPTIKKAVYIFRQPQDSLCSYYHFHRRYPRLQAETAQGIDAFCLRRLPDWMHHVASYVAAQRCGDCDVLFVSYECLHADPVCALMETARFLGLTVTEAMCRQAVDNHSFEKQRGTETLGKEYHEFFFRKGRVGSGKEELSEEAFARIQHKASRTYYNALSLQPLSLQPLSAPQGLSNSRVSQSSDDTSDIQSTARACSFAKVKLLNLGCGNRYHPDWVNVDVRSDGNGVMAHDLKKPLPFVDASFNAVYHSHLLEHFPKEYAPDFLKECFRVLRPGGIIRVAVPDLEQIIRLYLANLEQSLQGDAEAQKRYEWIVLELFDQMVRNRSGGRMLTYWKQTPMPAHEFVVQRMGSEVLNALRYIQNKQSSLPDAGTSKEAEETGVAPEHIGRFRLSGEVHQWMYDRYSLGKLLREAGFEDVRVCRPDESSIPDFNTYHLDIEPDGSVRKPDSLFMEGRKPAAASRGIDAFDAMKIAMISASDSGGAGKAAYRLHLGLEAAGAYSTMHVATKKSANREVHVIPGIDTAVNPLYAKRNAIIASRYPKRPQGLEIFTITESDVRLDGIKDIERADIVHLHWVADLLDYRHAAKVFQGKKIVWTLHDMNPFTGGCHYAGECRRYLKNCGACPQLGSERDDDLSREGWLRKHEAYKNLDITVVTPSSWLAACAQESALLGRFPVQVIPYGFPLDVFKPYPTDTARAALNIDTCANVVLFGADFIDNERKGFCFLLQALNILARTKNANNIVLAYFGRLFGSLTTTLPYPTVSFGEVGDENRLAMIYSSADVFVIPTLEDNLPNTVMEAMACGTPVVGFDVGGVLDMIDDKKTGRLVPPRDTQGLADAIAWVLGHRDDGAGLSKNCREKALLFSLERQASAYHALYKQLLSQPVGNRRNFCETTGKRLFIYVDPGFSHDIGHYTQMAAPLRRHTRENGIAMLHYVGNSVPQAVCDELQLIPLFNYPAYIQLENVNLEAILQDFARGLDRIKQEIEERYADYAVRVYMYTCHPVHLPVFAKVFGSVDCKDIKVFCNLFHVDRNFCNGTHTIHYEHLLQYVRQEFERENKKNIVCITNESERSAKRYEPWLGRQIIIDAQPVLEHPGDMAERCAAANIRIVLAYVGFPHERVGYPLVFRAYEAIMRSELAERVLFKVKHIKKHYNAETLRLYEAFTAQTKNIVHETNFLSGEAYDRFLRDCDIVLIPYSKKYYPVNTSGMLVDALLRKKVVVVPEGTWMADQLQHHGAGVTFESDNAASFIEAVKKAVETFDDLSRNTGRNIEDFAQKHSASHLFSQLGFPAVALPHGETATGAPAGGSPAGCPACGARPMVFIRTLKGQRSNRELALYQCRACGSLHNPSGYREDDTALRADRDFHIRVAGRNEGFSHALMKKLLSLHPRATTLLDVGAGIGTLMRIAAQYGLACDGVEPNPHAVEYARERYGFSITCDYYRSALFDRKFDIITIIHVLEHLSTPASLLREAVQNLNDNGIVFLSVPFFNARDHDAFLKNPDLEGTLFFDNDVHITHFTVAGLKKMAGQFNPSSTTPISAGWYGLALRFSAARRDRSGADSHTAAQAGSR